jgi:acetyl esterase/lipase
MPLDYAALEETIADMKAEPREAMRASFAPIEASPPLKPVRIGWRSRFVNWLLRWLLRPWLSRTLRGSRDRIAGMQMMTAGQRCRDTAGLSLEYRVVGAPDGGVPGHVLGHLADTGKSVVLWLHGGAFMLPASPVAHIGMVARLCRDLDAVGFLPDYRLAPLNKFPAALDDCERAYRALLDLGHAPERIAVGGDSAGGNLTLGLLQRIRKRGWPMPACAVPVSAVTELSREFGLPSRLLRQKQDPLLGIAGMHHVVRHYAGDHDTADPELSPLYADCRGFPPLYVLAGDNEVLRDDSVLFARRAREAGVDVQLDIWPVLPHAFPVFGSLFPEAAQAHVDIVAFMREQVTR